MSSTTPFFSQSLLVTAPDGSYGGLMRKHKQLSAYDDRLVLGGTTIPYSSLTGMHLYGNVLHVGYVGSDGKPVEEFFRFDQKNATAVLAEIEKRKSAVRSPQTETSKAVRAELLEPAMNGWQRVLVYSAMVAFPAICPVCRRPADAVAVLQMSAGMDEKGSWLIPVCRAHEKEFASHVSLQNWRAERSRLEFMFWNREYAEQFVMVNRGEETEKIRRQAESSPLLFDIRNGKRMVTYQYAMSVIVISMLRPSKVEVLEPGQSAFVRGLKYSGISLLAGWWGIPGGPIFTIASIVRNCRGGIDLTRTVEAVLTGSRLSAGGYR